MPEGRLPSIAVLATGGTIAGKQIGESSHAYCAASFGVKELLAAVPSLSALAVITAEQIANVGSQNMSHDIWLLLMQRVEALGKDSSIDGIVITHGTDTLEETAYFLSLVIQHQKPIVLVGAMRPATAPGADGPANLRFAVALAGSCDARGKGPLVVMNEDIHYAREVQKISSTGINAFASPNRGKAGIMKGDKPCFFSSHDLNYGDFVALQETIASEACFPRVDVVYAGVESSADVIDYLVPKVQGLVLAGVGDGNANDVVLAALQRAVRAGVAVVRSSRATHGTTMRNVEINDDAMGFIAAGDLSPAKARILLSLSLIQTTEIERLQDIFDRC